MWVRRSSRCITSVAQAEWSDTALLAAVADEVLPVLLDTEERWVWIVDDSGRPKKGLARQRSPALSSRFARAVRGCARPTGTPPAARGVARHRVAARRVGTDPLLAEQFGRKTLAGRVLG